MVAIFCLYFVFMFFFQNKQFAIALESRVKQLYLNSWISAYYRVETKTENHGVVIFYDTLTKAPSISYRYDIFVFIPEKTKPYFLSKYDWENLTSNDSKNVRTDLISLINHGFRTSPVPATRSIFYKSPFFIKLKTPLITQPNYLIYKGEHKNNYEDMVLAMITYNEESATFHTEFSPEISFSFLKSLSLTNVLEFTMYDANNNQVSLEDNSQLYIMFSIQSQ